MSLSDLTVRPLRPGDTEQLDLFRESFKNDGEIQLPFGYTNAGVATAVVARDEKIIGAVHATKALIVNFMKDPKASGPDIYAAVLLGERALTFVAEDGGCAEAYCAIPSHLQSYIDMVKRSGYTEAFPNCVILRRSLAKETPVK
jgi:hypothetical protein